MNCVVVRTKLQGIIVLEMIRVGIIKPPFIFSPVFQFEENEDDESLSIIYRKIGEKAFKIKPVNQSKGIFRNFFSLFVVSMRCLFSGGNIYVAIINYYVLALVLRVNIFSKIFSFDDGNANTQENSAYFSEVPLVGGGIKRFFAKLLFPKGSAKFCRSKIKKHFTIYPNSLNIVDKNKVELLIIDWELYLSPEDLAKMENPVKVIILGTVYRDHIGKNLEPQLIFGLSQSDIYMPHPRDNSKFSDGDKVVKFDAPAEAVIELLLKKTNTLKIFHFNSSVEASFRDDKRTQFIDLLRKDGEFYEKEIPVKIDSLRVE